MRDAIVLSGWTWETTNVPERLANALAAAGARVLYSELPTSIIRGKRKPVCEIAPNIHRIQPVILAHRVYSLAVVSKVQAFLHAQQIAREAKQLGLKSPVFFFPHGGEALQVALEMKRAGFDLVHVLMDYELPESLRHAEIADVVLAIPDRAFDDLKAQFGDKVYPLRQFAAPQLRSAIGSGRNGRKSELEAALPNPRLLYMGAVQERLDRQLLTELLRTHPEWHLISFGPGTLELPNHHVLPWLDADQLAAFLTPDTIGFLPYRLDDMKNLNCVPLKLFDFFAAGIPVVATPIAYLKKRPELVYLGRTASEVADAVRRAMSEPRDSPLKDRRRAFAREHSTEQSACYLAPLLNETAKFPPPEWTVLHGRIIRS